MRILALALGLLASGVSMLGDTAQAEIAPQCMKFAVMRGETQIGTNTINLTYNGDQTLVRIATHVAVSIALVKLYRFDQTETELWSNGRLRSLSSRTDDNGKMHSVDARSRQGRLVVHGDGRLSVADAAVLPVSLWNQSFLEKGIGLDPEVGSLVPVLVTDKGEDDLIVAGRSAHVHHFVIKTRFSQDVWYDQRGRLVGVKMHGLDGSIIHFEPIEPGG